MQLVLNHPFCPARWALLLVLTPLQAGAVAVDGATAQHLRAVQPGHILEEAKDAVIPGSGLPGSVAKRTEEKERKIMDAISQFRAEICFKMMQEHGTKFSSHEACEDYMKESCNPGKDKAMDGDGTEVTSEKGYCEEYFPKTEEKKKEQRKKAEKKVDDDEKKERESKTVVAPSPGPAGAAPGPAAAAPVPAEKAPAPAPAAAGAASAPSPGPAGAPGPASAPAPAKFTPGVSLGKPYGHIPDDEKYYYANGGKSDDRLHMSENMKLPTQGYWGKLVEHEDMKTSIEDWGHEFGPQAGHPSIRAICAKHPENPWCYEQGYTKHHKSSCPTGVAHVLSFVCALVAMRAL